MGAQSRRKRDGGKRYLRRYRCLMYVDYSRATAPGLVNPMTLRNCRYTSRATSCTDHYPTILFGSFMASVMTVLNRRYQVFSLG